MIAEWIKVVFPIVAAFAGACTVQGLSLLLQERKQKKLLRRSLYREMAVIYIELGKLLPHLSSIISSEKNRANLSEFVKATCFDTAKASPLFWRLKDSIGIIDAHNNFGLLSAKDERSESSAAIAVQLVLNSFRGLFDAEELHRRDLLKAGDGKITKKELTAVR